MTVSEERLKPSYQFHSYVCLYYGKLSGKQEGINVVDAAVKGASPFFAYLTCGSGIHPTTVCV